jgi:hypothetical protein
MMIKLKDMLKEHGLIVEGTRWLVGVEKPNGQIVSAYGHWDGYPKYVGKLLKKYYRQPSRVLQLLKLAGDGAGISSLDKSIKGGKDHSFDSPKKGETVFYGRDRGEKGSPQKFSNRDKVKWLQGEEFAYIYSLKEKKWYYKSRYKQPQEWTEL